MAQAGTTAQGQQPQNSNDPVNQQGNQPAGQAPEKLIAGKFKSIDDMGAAIDSGYHDLSEKVGQLTRLVEVLADNRQQQAPYQGVPVGRGGYRDDGYGRGPAPDEIDPKEFILNPGQVLKQREDNLRREMTQQVASVVQDVVGNMMAVNDFKTRHPELIPHEPLVQSFMSRTNPRDPLSKRLEDAGKQTADYLARSGLGRNPNAGANNAPNGANYIEAPARGQGQQQVPNSGNPQGPASDEAELAQYITERNNDFAAKFGIQIPK